MHEVIAAEQQPHVSEIILFWLKQSAYMLTAEDIARLHQNKEEMLERTFQYAISDWSEVTARLELEASLTYIYQKTGYSIYGLRLPKEAIYSVRAPEACHWYMPDGNAGLSRLFVGKESSNSQGKIWIPNRIQRLKPGEMAHIEPYVPHALVNSGNRAEYAVLVTPRRPEQTKHRLAAFGGNLIFRK